MKPAVITGSAHKRILLRRTQSHIPPIATITRPAVGIAGTSATEPGRVATLSAISRTIDMPYPIDTSARLSNPAGIRRKLMIPSGIIHIAITGTATRLAISP